MAGFKEVMILVVVFCLVSNSLAMSLPRSTDLDEDSAAARYFRRLEKRTFT